MALENKPNFDRRAVLGIIGASAVIGAVSAISGKLLKKKSNEGTEESKREKAVVNAQITFLSSLSASDLEAISKIGDLPAREAELAKLIDNKFKTMGLSNDIGDNAKNKLIDWFRNSNTMQGATSAREIRNAVNAQWRVLAKQRDHTSNKKVSTINGAG